MEINKARLRISVLILSGLIIILAGCGTVKTYPSKVRELPDTVGTKLSVGDTRQEARSLLGEPLIVNKSLGLEVYRFTGRDTDIDLTPIPLPLPSPYKVSASALVLYDEADKIKDIAARARSRAYPLRISAGGYIFTSEKHLGSSEPETLIGPPIFLDELSNKSGQAGACSVVFLMGACPMELISIDDVQIADLSPPSPWMQVRTFFKKDITPGTHRLLVRQTTYVKDRDFENAFDCANGDTVYVELDASKVRHLHWWRPWFELVGDLVVSKTPSIKHTEGKLRPILWHNGVWYGE